MLRKTPIIRKTPIKRSQKPLKRTAIKKSTKPINKVSKPQAVKNRKFAAAKKIFLAKNEECVMKVVPECTFFATEVHHGAGKASEELLLDTRYFVPGCSACHRWVEVNPIKAKELGLSFDRTDK